MRRSFPPYLGLAESKIEAHISFFLAHNVPIIRTLERRGKIPRQIGEVLYRLTEVSIQSNINEFRQQGARICLIRQKKA